MDLVRLSTDPDLPRTNAPVLQRLRARHHSVARYLATGKSIRETAILVGLTAQRVGDLTRDPTFQDLLAFYSEQKSEIAMDTANRVQEKLLEMAELAGDEILDRLEDDTKRAAIPIGELRQIQTAGLDRTVAPPKTAQPVVSTPTHITFNMGNRDIRPKNEIEIEITPNKENSE